MPRRAARRWYEPISAPSIRLGRIIRALMTRPRGIDGAPGPHAAARLAARGAAGRRRRDGSPGGPGSAPLEPRADRRGAPLVEEALRDGPGRSRCRRRSPPCTVRRAGRGHGLAADRPPLRVLERQQPSPVVALNRAGRGDGDAPRPRSRWSMDSPPAASSTGNTCCTPREPSCCAGSATAQRREELHRALALVSNETGAPVPRAPAPRSPGGHAVNATS